MSRTPDPREYRLGQRRLRELLPAARARKGELANRPEELSALALAVLPHISEDNFDSLIIYEADRGGWHADLLLKDTPPGVSNAFGSPMAMPFRTRHEAEEFAVMLLASLLSMADARDRGEIKAGPPTFGLHSFTIPLDPKKLELIASLMAAGRDLSQADVNVGLHRTLERLGMLHSVTEEQFDGLSREDRALLLSALHAAAVQGVFTWPPLTARPPGDKSALERL